MYQKASEFLVGLQHVEPPVLVWIDYIQHNTGNLDREIYTESLTNTDRWMYRQRE